MAFARVMLWQLSHAWYGEIIRAQVAEAVGAEHAAELQYLVTELLTAAYVDENLVAAAHLQKSRRTVKQSHELVYAYFPRLRERRTALAGYLSGGEQQMLVIGRALMAQPRLMLLDEPSLGLSPLLVAEIFHIIKKINEEQKTTILLVEQNARLALTIANYGYIMENGRIVLDDTVDRLRENEDVKRFYLGVNEGGTRRSYRDVKHYKRRKRWLT